jgi:hypothetical protein
VDATDTASWLTNHGWVTDSLDSRSEMARLARPIPPEFSRHRTREFPCNCGHVQMRDE